PQKKSDFLMTTNSRTPLPSSKNPYTLPRKEERLLKRCSFSIHPSPIFIYFAPKRRATFEMESESPLPYPHHHIYFRPKEERFAGGGSQTNRYTPYIHMYTKVNRNSKLNT